MRKIKKINGFLVVKFNDREKREYEGTALGEYGVIDAEVYTGNLDIDRGAMEYDDADTLEVAVELARGLESEEDITDEPPTYTAAVETNESYTEEAVEPTALIEGWTRRLATQVKSKHYPDTDPRTAAHELYGFKMALHQIGFLPESEAITDPDTFGAGRLDGPMPRNPEELLAFVCDERCKNRAGHTQEELDAICAKCPLGQLYEDAEAQDLRIRDRSERALREHIEGVRHAEDTVTALLGGHEALAYGLLANGFTEKCYDGKAFFATDHPVGKDKASNKGTAKLSMDAYKTARTSMMSLKNSKGRPLALVPDLLVVPPALEADARDILVADFINGTKNTMQGTAEIHVEPRLASDSAWFLLCTKRPVKPLIYQQRKKAKFVSKTNETDDNVFMSKKFIYGADSRGNAGFGFWQMAYGSDGTTT